MVSPLSFIHSFIGVAFMFVCVQAGKQIEKGGLLQAHKSIEVKVSLQ